MFTGYQAQHWLTHEAVSLKRVVISTDKVRKLPLSFFHLNRIVTLRLAFGVRYGSRA
jgi:hypothetical protein